MKAIWSVDGNEWRLQLQLHPEDPVTGPGQGSQPVSLLAREARVYLPTEVTEPHPDLEALAALVIARPWITRRLVVRRGVTKAFAELTQSLFKIEVTPVDDELATRAPGSTPLLAYSAGFDSAAASLLLPPDTPHVHHRRFPHPRVPNRATHWPSGHLEQLVKRAGQRGRDVRVVRADFEYLVHPYPSLPHWFGFAVGALLMADHLSGGAIAMGGTLETFYMDMGRRWTGERPTAKGMDDLPALTGLPIMRPVLGLTEVGTMALTLNSELADIARSCTSGGGSQPCGSCLKCIRKDMLTATLTGSLPTSLRTLTREAPGYAAITKSYPHYMQAQLEYALARLDVAGNVLAELRDKLSPDADDTAWMAHAYRPAVTRGVPEPWRDYIDERIENSLGWMTDEEMATAHSWERLAN